MPSKTTPPKAKKAAKKAPRKTAQRTHKLTPNRPVAPGSKLTHQQQRFVDEYLLDLHGKHAAIRAGYAPKAASQQAYDLLNRPHIQEAIQKAMKERAARVQISQDEVLRELIGIATADPNELVEHRKVCCRYCHGDGNDFQRTPAEMARDRAEHAQAQQDAKKEGKTIPPFDVKGGTGYNATYPPNPDCPECFGEGVDRPVFKDTRLASPAARALYAGVKITKDGMEVKMHSQLTALELIGKHLEMFTDTHKHKGDKENPLHMLLASLGGKSSLPVVHEDQRAPEPPPPSDHQDAAE